MTDLQLRTPGIDDFKQACKISAARGGSFDHRYSLILTI